MLFSYLILAQIPVSHNAWKTFTNRETRRGKAQVLLYRVEW